MKKLTGLITLGCALLSTDVLSAECYVCSYVGGQTSCAPTQPRSGYHVCTVMAPGWCEVSQPCNFYGPPKAMAALARFVPKELIFGAAHREEPTACAYDYQATKRLGKGRLSGAAVS